MTYIDVFLVQSPNWRVAVAIALHFGFEPLTACWIGMEESSFRCLRRFTKVKCDETKSPEAPVSTRQRASALLIRIRAMRGSSSLGSEGEAVLEEWVDFP